MLGQDDAQPRSIHGLNRAGVISGDALTGEDFSQLAGCGCYNPIRRPGWLEGECERVFHQGAGKF